MKVWLKRNDRNNMVTLFSALTLYMILGHIESSEFYVSQFSGGDSGSKFDNLIIDQNHGWVFVGGVNCLYQLNDNLELISSHKNGPEPDSFDCPVNGNCPNVKNKILTNNHNKVLVIDYSTKYPRLISCGSIFQGLCQVHNNINNISTDVDTVFQPVVANDETSSTVAFIGPGPSKRSSSSFVLYVGATITNNSIYRVEVPMVASRSLETDRMMTIFEESVDSGTKILPLSNFKYFVNYVYGFSSAFFTYFLTTQMKSAESSPYISKLIRICNEDNKYYTYTEIPIKCIGNDGRDYNLAQAAFIMKMKPEYAELLNLHISLADDVLFVVFSKSEINEGNGSNKPSKHSALCVYSLNAINKQFLENVRKCFKTGGNRGLRNTITPLQRNCIKMPGEINDEDFCKLDYDTQLEGDIPVTSTPLIIYDTIVPTAVSAALIDNHVIVFMGTNEGYLKKIIIKNPTTVIEFDDIAINNSPVNRNILFDPKMIHLYVMTKNKLIKVKIRECEIHRTCKSCLATIDQQCGWCSLQNRCTSKDNCVMKAADDIFWTNSKQGACISITDVTPKNIPCYTSTRLKINVENFPIITEQLQCIFKFSTMPVITNATRENFIVFCDTPKLTMIPQQTPAEQYFTTQLSLKTISRSEFLFANVTFFNCTAFTSCTSCISSQFRCNWCLTKHQCLYNTNENSKDNIILSSEHCNELDGRVGLEYCPTIKATSDTNDILISNGTTKSIKFNTRITAQFLKSEIFSCQFTIEARVINVNATLDAKDILHCHEIEFSYSQSRPNSAVSFKVLWDGWKPLDNPSNIQFMIYKCNEMALNCGACLALEKKYQCGWCDNINQCEPHSHCENESSNWAGLYGACPNPTILSFEPQSGLLDGQTYITIKGINLGQTVDEVHNITVADSPCIPIKNSSYESHTTIVCQINQSDTISVHGVRQGPVTVQVGKFSDTSTKIFTFVDPEIVDISPKQGPQSGGTELSIKGNYMDAGNSVHIFINNNIPCSIFARNFSELKCYTGASNRLMSGEVTVKFDSSISVREYKGVFTYVADPIIRTFEFGHENEYNGPKGIPAGGTRVNIQGQHLSSIQNPLFYVYNENRTKCYYSECEIVNESMHCLTPYMPDIDSLFTDQKYLDYGFQMDDVATVQNISMKNPDNFKKFKLYPNPTFNPFPGEGIKFYNPDHDKYLSIDGENIDSVCQTTDISVTIGNNICEVALLSSTLLTCRLPQPSEFTRESKTSTDESQDVIVCVGQHFQKKIGKLVKHPQTGWVTFVFYCGAFVMVVIVLIFIILLAIYCKKFYRKSENLKKIRKRMDELELGVAMECKAAFADLQTEITDLTTNISSGGIPFFEYRTYVMNVMFPNTENHSNILTEKSEIFGKDDGLQLFGQLVTNKTFLLLFIRTLENNEDFSMNDRVFVASRIMITLQNNMDYCTDILITLLGQLIKKYMKSNDHPKLLLRQTESIVEKMLSTWFTFLLYKFLKEKAGEPLYTLFSAIKKHVNKGPIDAITFEARYSLSEDKIIRQHVDEYKSMTIYVTIPKQTALITGLDKNDNKNIEDIPVKVLDCDTISQVKEKAIDIIYNNIRYSQRPLPSDLEIEWLIDNLTKKVLSDDDDSSKIENRWRQLNTLNHYGVPDGSMFDLALVKKRSISSVSTLSVNNKRRPSKSTTGSWKSVIFHSTKRKLNKSLSMPAQARDVNYKPWHLVKPRDPNDINSCEIYDMNDKMVSEIYLTRLLSTKGTLQKFVDDLFGTIFNAKFQDSGLSLAIKYMFDFLDEQALHHGITDQDVVHTWKSNCLPLRFWINLIKNPNFIFDMHKPNIVDSCLSVVAQAFMDSCSTSDHHLNKDSPTSKLLYAKDIPNYKKQVERYYADIKLLPAVSDQDMSAMLNEESHLHACEFNTNVALYALYEYAVKYNDQLMVCLKEDEFAQKYKLIQKLEKVHNLMAHSQN